MEPRALDLLFCRTVDDVAERTGQPVDGYRLLRAALLVRQLIIDDPLVHQVQRHHKLKVRVRYRYLKPAVPPGALLADYYWVSGGVNPDPNRTVGLTSGAALFSGVVPAAQMLEAAAAFYEKPVIIGGA